MTYLKLKPKILPVAYFICF